LEQDIFLEGFYMLDNKDNPGFLTFYVKDNKVVLWHGMRPIKTFNSNIFGPRLILNPRTLGLISY
jgi:hypothetical protein